MSTRRFSCDSIGLSTLEGEAMSYNGYAGHFRSHSDSSHDDLLFKIWIASILLVISGFIYISYEGQVWATWVVSFRTWPLYIATIAACIFGVCWWRQHENFSDAELVFYICVAIPTVYVSTCLGWLFLTDLGDLEISNGHAVKAEWTEAYYVRTTTKKGTRTSYYGPSYTIYTSNDGEYVTISSSNWNSYLKHWGGWSRVSSSRNWFATGESLAGSNGNGRPETHVITWDGSENARVVTGVERRYANFLKASDSVLKVQGTISGYDNLLVDYPRTQDAGFGNVDFNRVIVAGVNVSPDFQKTLDRQLDVKLDQLGQNVRCNVVVYLVGTEREGFYTALQKKWFMGKENDVAVVIGSTNGTKINWCRVMSLTDHKLFVEKLERSIRDLKSLKNNAGRICDLICEQIKAPGEAGYLAKPMSDFAYLAAEAKMPFWAGLLVILGSCIVLLPTISLVIRD